MKKGIVISIFLLLFVVFGIFDFFLVSYNANGGRLSFPTGKGVVGTVSLMILRGPGTIAIDSPENKTYNFNIGDVYTIGLNVSTEYNISVWTYTLEDLKHGKVIYKDVGFTPNSTINAVRWGNRLTVNATASMGAEIGNNVLFNVNVPNSAPSIEQMGDIYICENDVIAKHFIATDVDEDSLSSDISPKDPFYITPQTSPGDSNISDFNIISGTLGKDAAGGINGGKRMYGESVSVTDGQYSDTRKMNITVIEINNAPVFDNIGVQTVWTKGDQSRFLKQAVVNDVEDGNSTAGNLNFTLNFLNSGILFNISTLGVMDFSPVDAQIGTYSLSVCSVDRGISNPDVNISLCGQNGSSTRVCRNFSLTVTNENRQPTIVSYYPSNNLNLKVGGTSSTYYNVSTYDADGTVPDIYWYADGIFKRYSTGSLNDEFTHSFGCGISGNHTVKVFVTDGLLNDSVTWNVNVSFAACPVSSPGGGGGGGGGGGTACFGKWVCGDWGTCQNLEKSLAAGILAGEDYRITKEYCNKNSFDENHCGIQTRACGDLNKCNSSLNQPSVIQGCFYSELPSCTDGMKNCHDNACEVLIDCGGPCQSCPSCSDGTQNQGEEGVDCGGPCPKRCEVEVPAPKGGFFLISLFTLLAIILVVILARRWVLIARKRRKELSEKK